MGMAGVGSMMDSQAEGGSQPGSSDSLFKCDTCRLWQCSVVTTRVAPWLFSKVPSDLDTGAVAFCHHGEVQGLELWPAKLGPQQVWTPQL